jgi:hypothetical protein
VIKERENQEKEIVAKYARSVSNKSIIFPYTSSPTLHHKGLKKKEKKCEGLIHTAFAHASAGIIPFSLKAKNMVPETS